MANEGVLKFNHPISGLGTVTAKILKPDDTVRDNQTAEVLDDIGHANLYTNDGGITIFAGDSVQFSIAGVNITAGTYQPEVSVVNLAEAMKAITGLSVAGGTWTWEKIMRITTAFIAGNWRVKSSDISKQELMDAENGTTIILEQSITRSPSAGNKYRNITVLI